MIKKQLKNAWLQRQDRDPFVKLAKAQGYRSRASFKLLELQQKYRLFKPGMDVIDLGAAPGGWSQVLSHLVGKTGSIIALDLLTIAPIENVTIIQGDFTSQSTDDALQHLLGGKKIDWVVSDMAPNMSGTWMIDQAKSMYLVECALAFAQQTLKNGGGFLVKSFQGNGFEMVLKTLRTHFKTVVVKKPKASRAESREIYLLATGYNIE